ncbi:MAG: DUF1289 domain-containing protein [Woeseiaceae bacterium]|nr:DUF1289 domain-containing protein [Woeseiaceae bacterium]
MGRDGFPDSPCILVCTLDDDERCVGCGRTLDQISRWALMSPEEQWSIVETLEPTARVAGAE